MSPIERFCREHHNYNDISADRRTMQRRVLADLAETVSSPLEVGPAELQAFLASRLESGLCPATVKRELSAIRPFYRWAWRNKLIDADRLMGIEDIRPPRGAGKPVPKPYNRKQLQKFWAELDEKLPRAEERYLGRWQRGTSRWKRVQKHFKRVQMEVIVGMALYGALRLDEIWRLTIPDMHYENSVVVVRGARKNPDAQERARAVPMLTPMHDAIEEWLGLRELLKPTHERPWLSCHNGHRAKPMQHRTFEMLLRNVGSGWKFHRLRHTAATEMLRATMPVEKVSKVLGHSSVEQTLAYTELLTGDLIDASLRAEGKFVGAVQRTKGDTV